MHAPDLASIAMGIETLRSAERAAGFAMVDVEDAPRETAEPKAGEGRRIGTPALLLKEQGDAVAKDESSFGEWVKHVLGAGSGRAPA